jgi:hypothetical protein
VITEVLDLKGLRKGMNRQDINQEDQKADDQLQIFYFCIRLIIRTKQEVIQCPPSEKQCLHSNFHGFINKT